MNRTSMALSLAALLACATAQAASLKISCGAVGQELEMCRTAAQEWARKTGHEVQVVATPNDGSERLALYQQVLSSRSDKIDVFQVDVVWPGMLASHLLDLQPHAKGAEKQHFPGILANVTVGGKLVAMPWFTDAGLLYYRRDLLEKHGQKVPTTWDELGASAKKIQDAERASGNERLWGYVWQGRAYEGLTCNAVEWLASHGGGTVVEPDGKVSVKNPQAVKAVQTAAGWVGTISPTAVLNYGEEDARGVFQAGNAVYMRNWPYAWSLSQAEGSAVKGKVGIAVLPKGGTGGRHAAALGGQLLAVSKYSRNPEVAADLVIYMTSQAVQKERALKGSFNPTIAALYKDADILKANPFMAELHETFTSAVGRPATVTGAKYNQVSNQFWNAVHEVLSGKAKAEPALAELEASVQRLGRGGKWR
ncbi:ABC transporter substrate-binding protein [Aquabacterium sp. A7-Y]|uniref:ABC transporter substrate-binding protein n=1 Tax=Aquabacterium sp. A7-Y TaxID=1349605 RepID=UPI00223C9982|nr:ABC transporter substrate-binding protein [Aquabacterium sp. A7-Y]MCW7540591.1 ABC transporter substrate-binding protein [Aquabacterium sp. A7-Y]